MFSWTKCIGLDQLCLSFCLILELMLNVLVYKLRVLNLISVLPHKVSGPTPSKIWWRKQ